MTKMSLGGRGAIHIVYLNSFPPHLRVTHALPSYFRIGSNAFCCFVLCCLDLIVTKQLAPSYSYDLWETNLRHAGSGVTRCYEDTVINWKPSHYSFTRWVSCDATKLRKHQRQLLLPVSLTRMKTTKRWRTNADKMTHWRLFFSLRYDELGAVLSRKH